MHIDSLLCRCHKLWNVLANKSVSTNASLFFILFLFTFHFSFFAPSRAQVARLYTLEHGLQSSYISSLYVDHSNMLWISTSLSLELFDGHRFHNINYTDPLTGKSLFNEAKSIRQIDDHHYMVMTNAGLFEYDISTNHFTRIKLSVDEAHKIIDAKALNDDGNIILDEMDLKGVDINTACNALAGSMLKHGYLSEMSNSVMVSVQSENKEDGLAIEQMVSGNLNDYLQDTEISGAVLGQYVDGDEALAAFAAEHNISAGKAWLIKNLMATNSKHMTEDALLKLSTQELILLSQERDVDVDDFYGDVDKSKYISKEDAIKAALQAAGLNDLQVDSGRAEFDCDDGIITYEVEFTANGQEYEYDINAQTGEIIKSEVDVDDGDDDADDDADDADDEYDDDHDADDYDDDYDDGHDDDHDDHDHDDDDHDEDD